MDNGTIVKKTGFVDVVSENIEIVIDNTTYHQIRFMPEQHVTKGSFYKKDKNGKDIVFAGGDHARNENRTRHVIPAR